MTDADRSIGHKRDELRREGSLNPHPEAVHDPLFHGDPFFDPDDLVQVKYEMLRAEVRDGVSVTDAAARFGLSRVTFYQVRRSFDEAGLAGLFPKKRGPRGGHKLTPEVIAFLFERLRAAPTSSEADLAREVAQRFGVHVHVRSIHRVLLRGEKKQ